jgi:hypothetical protein
MRRTHYFIDCMLLCGRFLICDDHCMLLGHTFQHTHVFHFWSTINYYLFSGGIWNPTYPIKLLLFYASAAGLWYNVQCDTSMEDCHKLINRNCGFGLCFSSFFAEAAELRDEGHLLCLTSPVVPQNKSRLGHQSPKGVVLF